MAPQQRQELAVTEALGTLGRRESVEEQAAWITLPEVCRVEDD